MNHFKTETYTQLDGHDCQLAHKSTPERPCWGRTYAWDEVGGVPVPEIYVCQGHASEGDGGLYLDEKTRRYPDYDAAIESQSSNP